MEIVVRNPLIAHHLIPWSLQENKLIQKAAEGFTTTVNGVVSHDAFHMNEFANGFPINAFQHGNGHPLYIDKIKIMLDEMDEYLINNGLYTPEKAAIAVRHITNSIKNIIIANSNKTLDEIANLL